MPALRISARTERVNRKGTYLWSKLDHADIGAAGNAISSFLSGARSGVERKDSAIVTIHASNRETRLRVLKLFVLAFVKTLQAIKFAPRDLPRPKVTLQCIDNIDECCDRILLVSPRHPLVPETEE